MCSPEVTNANKFIKRFKEAGSKLATISGMLCHGLLIDFSLNEANDNEGEIS